MAGKFLTTRQKRKLLSLVLSLVVSSSLLVAQHYGWLNSATQSLKQTQPGLYAVTEFVDGDTIAVDMNGKNEFIRFIGVDTPETHDPRKNVQCYGQVAAAYTKNLIGTNDIRLETDPTNTNRDRYNRLLRYIYLPDGRLVNAEIIREGYGFAYTSFPFTKMEEFRNLQNEAQQNKRGLWKDCMPAQNEYGGYTSNDAP